MLDTELLITAYESGYFPMAMSREDTDIHWFNPDPRAIIPLNQFHLPRSLKKALRKRPFTVTINHAFADVLHACAQPRDEDRDSWISTPIITAYQQLHELGHAHSVECWEGETLAGGLYGVSRGGAFFGESMFSRRTNASKIAFAYLLEVLLSCRYQLLDTQFVNPHLEQFGVVEIPRNDYLHQLSKALIALSNPSRQFVVSGKRVVAADPSTFKVMPPVASRMSE